VGESSNLDSKHGIHELLSNRFCFREQEVGAP